MAKKRLQKKRNQTAVKKSVAAPVTKAPVTPAPAAVAEAKPVIEETTVVKETPASEAVRVIEPAPVLEIHKSEDKKAETAKAPEKAEPVSKPDWHKNGSLLGMMLYAPENIEEKLDYIQECGVNYLYLLPGSYQENELSALADKCHSRGIRICVNLDAISEERALSLAKQGADILRLDSSVEKTITNALRSACPQVLFMGENEACDILYKEDSMAVLWHTVATKDVFLLRGELDKAAKLPKDCVMQSSLRSDKPVVFDKLNFEYLKDAAVEEAPHKEFLSEYLSGNYWDSFARGELYRENEDSQPALCGTTASLCGIERYGFEGNEEGVDRSIRYDVTLHALLLSLPGIPMIYSGDELGQLNDYSYKENPEKASDCRWLHKGGFNAALAANRSLGYTVQGKLFPALRELENLRAEHSVFGCGSELRTIDTWDSTILSFVLENDKEKFIGIYNFGENENVAWINEDDGKYTDLLSGGERDAKGIMVPAFGFFWLCKEK